jgi:aminoglycoside phosphotransferase (APT) family kinase protein
MHRLNDPKLPELARALDCAAMQARLAEAAGCAPQGLMRCEIERVKYRPGRSALVLYRALIERASSAREALVYATVYPAGIELHAFPSDRKLPGLALVGDAERLRDALWPEVMRQSWGQAMERTPCRISRVSYFPEHAYTARVALEVDSGTQWTTYVKTEATPRGARTLATMRALWETRHEREAHLRLARPLLYQERASALWQEAVPGTPLEEMAKSRLGCALAGQVGKALAALHGARVEGLAPLDPRAHVQRMAEIVSAVETLLPGIARRARCVVDALAADLPQGSGRPATLHGDLHLNNIIVHAGRVALVDLDDACVGPPELELGSFVAGLMYRALLHGAESMAQDVIADFLDGYRAVAPYPIDGAHVRWYAAAAIVHERAWRCLTSLKPGRFELIDELFALASTLREEPCLT